MAPNEIHTPTAVVRLDEHGISRIIMASGTEETLADAQAVVRACAALNGGKRRPVFVDMRGMKSQERAARIYYGGPDALKVCNSTALLVGSRVSALMANFFISVTKGSVPTKLFNDEAEAIAWLKGFLA